MPLHTSKYAKRPFAGVCEFRFRHSSELHGEPDLGVLANQRACYVLTSARHAETDDSWNLIGGHGHY